MSENKKNNEPIVIKLNSNNFFEKSSYLNQQEDELTNLILDRIDKFKTFKENYDYNTEEEFYNDIKRHDSIHIDGVRGSGKSTIIKFLASDNSDTREELKNNVKFLPIIDPNQLDKNTNIIETAIDMIMQKVKEEYLLSKYKQDKTRNFNDICNLKEKIDELIFKTYSQDYSNYTERSKITTGEMQLDFTFHQFAKKSSEFFGKTTLILPIDDIDMRLDAGWEILEIIRKYFQTPHLIPIIALDSHQAYALVKKDYYEAFDYKANTPEDSIKSNTGLGFLRKLPSEYLQKILPPSQRVTLFDMLEHYKKIKDDNLEVYFKLEIEDKCMTIDFDNLLMLLMNILFGQKLKEKEDYRNDYRVINYLKNKSFRSFLDDARALMKGLTPKIRGEGFILDTKHLKQRFQLHSRSFATDKYDGATWFWKKYIDKLYAELDKVSKKDDVYKAEYVYVDFIEDILVVEPYDTSGLGRKEKIYYRLFLQEFYIDEIYIEFAKQDNIEKINIIDKKYNIAGYFEFIMRIYFPAILFENLINSRVISLLKFPIEQLQNFSRPDGVISLVKLYDEWVPFWTEMYDSEYVSKNSDEKSIVGKPLAIKLDNDITNPFRKLFLNITSKEDFFKGEQSYYLHPFKELLFYSEFNSIKIKNLDFISNYYPKAHLTKEGGRIFSFKNSIKKRTAHITNLNKDILITHKGAINMINTIQLTRDLVENILLTIPSKSQIIQDIYFNELKKYFNLDKKTVALLYKIEVKKNLSIASIALLNLLIRNFISNYKEQKDFIERAPVLAPCKIPSILLPFVKQDPFLDNLETFFKLNKLDNMDIKNILLLFSLAELDNIYNFDKIQKKEKNEKKKKKNENEIKKEYNYIQEIMRKHTRFDYNEVKSLILNLLDNKNTAIENAYLELFSSFIKKHKLITTIKNYNKDNHNDIISNINEKKYLEKDSKHYDNYENKDYINYINKNTAILLIETIKALEYKIITKIISKLEEK